VKELHERMLTFIENGRSTQGDPQKNDVEVQLEKSERTKRNK
jgi:hypothetical protein